MDGEEQAPTPAGPAETQAETDARVRAAFEAYERGRTVPGEDGKPRKPKPLDEITPLWEAMWIAADFSWAGLADAGWDRGDRANLAQKLKRWRAPADFPGGGALQGEGEAAWKPASLQDYWRFAVWRAGGGADRAAYDPARIDEAMAAAGLLVPVDGRLFFALHVPGMRLSVALDTGGEDVDLRSNAGAQASEGQGGEGAALARLLAACLASATNYAGVEASDGRVQLAGARARGLDAAWRAYQTGDDQRLHLSAFLSDLTGLDATGLAFGDGATFSGATLGDGASFFRATLGDGATFSEATLGDRASFSRATLGDGASFFRATLGDRASFSRATLKGRAFWSRAVFQGVSDYSNVTWSPETHYGGAFDSARFEDVANFKTENFSAFAAFDDATFKQRLLLQPPSDSLRPEDMFARALKAAGDRIDADITSITEWKKARNETDEAFAVRKAAAPRAIRDRVWRELSGGYRVAKQAMEEQGDVDREQTYYRFEVKARMRRPGINPGERIASWFYRVFSDYGASIGRPFLGLATFLLVFAALYLVLAVTLTGKTVQPPWQAASPYVRLAPPANETWQALEFSLNNAFRPLSALSTDEPREGDTVQTGTADPTVADALLFNRNGLVRFIVKLMAIIQSLLSFVLAFLFGLAVRRKFQIS